jgi:hypothetical protein
MIHARSDYDRIQDPAVDNPSLLSPGSTPIAPSEPVVLFRAQDKFMPEVLRAYAKMLENQPGYSPALDKVQASVLDFIPVVETWQEAHGCKLPDL